MNEASTVTVTGLFVYPLKSARGIALSAARLAPLGLEHDRGFMVVREDGRFVTQRDLPRLALLETRIDGDSLVLSAPGAGSLPVAFEGERGPVQVSIWGQECAAIDLGEAVSDWLGRALREPDRLRLVRMAPGFVRPQGKPRELGIDTHTRFADAAPYLVANETSLAALNRELESGGRDAVPMDRFRPNVVLDGPAAFAEHTVKRAEGPGYALRFAHPCQRCVVTTIDQATGRRDPRREPYLTLTRLNPMPGRPGAPAFAHNAALADGAGATIRVGDTLILTGETP